MNGAYTLLRTQVNTLTFHVTWARPVTEPAAAEIIASHDHHFVDAGAYRARNTRSSNSHADSHPVRRAECHAADHRAAQRREFRLRPSTAQRLRQEMVEDEHPRRQYSQGVSRRETLRIRGSDAGNIARRLHVDNQARTVLGLHQQTVAALRLPPQVSPLLVFDYIHHCLRAFNEYLFHSSSFVFFNKIRFAHGPN